MSLATHDQYDRTMKVETMVNIVRDLEQNPLSRYRSNWEHRRLSDLKRELRKRGIKIKS
jgi:hypothetical protein